MTYNFDPDRWYASHLAIIENRRIREDLDDEVVARLIADLDKRYENLVERLDGTYEIPATGGGGEN